VRKKGCERNASCARLMNLLSQKWEALGREAVMEGVSRLAIANNVRVRRTFIRRAQIENAIDDKI
jgi:hypothetical protein